VKVGITTDEIDFKVHQQIISHGAYPSPLLYSEGPMKNFPKSICTSVNEVMVHGIPDSRPLENGDIIKIDVTVFYEGFHGDTAATFCVGEVDAAGKKLIKITEECMLQGISAAGPDVPLCKIGDTIFKHATSNNFSVMPEMVGHGIGELFHDSPYVFFVPNNIQTLMKPGMTFTIEPVILETSKWNSEDETLINIWDDGWTIAAEKNIRSAQFEHTILITNSSVEILTLQK